MYKDKFLNSILTDLRENLDIETLKQSLVNNLGKILNVSSCWLLEFTPDMQFQDIKYEFLRSDISMSHLNMDIDPSTITPGLGELIKNCIGTLVSDTDKFVEENNLSGTTTEEYFKNYNVKAGFSLPIKYTDGLLGLLILSFDKKNAFTEEDVDIAKSLISEISFIMNHAVNVDELKKNAARQEALCRIISAIRTHSDINDIKNIVLDEICGYFKADRTFINFTYQKHLINMDAYIERLASPEARSLMEIDPTAPYASYCAEWMTNKNGVLFNDSNLFIKEQNLQEHPMNEFLNDFQVRASLTVSIPFREEILGVMGVNFCKPQFLTQDDYIFMQTIAENIGIAFNKIMLYEQIQEKAKKEEYLKNFVTKIRHSIELDDVLNVYANEMKNKFNVDQVTIVKTPCLADYSQWSIVKYLPCEPTIRKNTTLKEKNDIGVYWNDVLSKNNWMYSIKDRDEENLSDTISNYMVKASMKSVIAITIRNEDNIWGVIYLYNKKEARNWTTKELELAKTVTEKAYYAIIHANMYLKLKKQLAKEDLLRTDDSLLINKKLAKAIGLGEAITYSILTRNYNEKLITEKINAKEFLNTEISKIQNLTHLDQYTQRQALENLTDIGLIESKGSYKKNIIYKVPSDSDSIIKRCIIYKEMKETNNAVKNDIADQSAYTVNELKFAYNRYFSKEVLDLVEQFIKMVNNRSVDSIKSTKPFFSMLCRTIYEFITINDICYKEMELIIDSIFNYEYKNPNNKILNPIKIQTKRLKKILLYKVYELKLLANDYNSKIDISIPELSTNNDLKALEELLQD